MNQNTQLTDDTIDLRALFFTLLAQWKLIIFCTVLAFICAVGYLKIAKKTYSVDAKIQMIDNKPSSLAGLSPQLAALGSLAGINLGGGQQSIQTEIEILQSRSILVKTIQDLNLDLQIQPEQSLFTQLLSEDQFFTDYQANDIKIKDNKTTFVIRQFKVPTEYLDQNLVLTFNGQTFSLVAEKTGVEVFKGNVNQKILSNTLPTGWAIEITSQQPLKGSYIVQKQSILTAVQTVLQHLKVAELNKQTGIIAISYDGSEQAHIVKVLNRILDIYQTQNLETKSVEKQKTLAFLDQQLPQLKNNLEQAESKFNKFRETHGTIDIQQEAGLYLKQSVELETQKIQLEQKQAELAAQYTSQHPMMREINAQIDVFNRKINELNGALKKLPNTQSQYLQYYRDVQVQTQLYTNLLGTYQSLNLAKAGETGNLRVLDYPVEPIKPIKPRKLVILILSIFLGGFLGVLIALMRNLLQTGIRHREEIEQATGIKTYLELPNVKKGQTSFSAIDSFIPTLQFKLQQKQHNLVLFSSIDLNKNQSSIAKTLAVHLGQTGEKVLLVDAAIMSGELHQYFDIATKTGLSEYLQGQANLEQILNSTPYANLSLITCGQPSDGISISSSQKRFAQLIEQVRDQYDYVILNATPIRTNADSLNIAKYTGFNLCLVQYGKTQLKDIELAKSYFENAGLEMDGIIIDQVPAYQK